MRAMNRAKLGQLAVAAISAIVSGPIYAKERATVCAHYEREDGSWSGAYKVEATILSGSELNTATRTFEYSALSTYVVIFWDDDEVSIIEMGFPTVGLIALEGEDQAGRKWKVAKTTFCV